VSHGIEVISRAINRPPMTIVHLLYHNRTDLFRKRPTAGRQPGSRSQSADAANAHHRDLLPHEDSGWIRAGQAVQTDPDDSGWSFHVIDGDKAVQYSWSNEGMIDLGAVSDSGWLGGPSEYEDDASDSGWLPRSDLSATAPGVDGNISNVATTRTGRANKIRSETATRRKTKTEDRLDQNLKDQIVATYKGNRKATRERLVERNKETVKKYGKHAVVKEEASAVRTARMLCTFGGVDGVTWFSAHRF
jgi:hypothetical protein